MAIGHYALAREVHQHAIKWFSGLGLSAKQSVNFTWRQRAARDFSHQAMLKAKLLIGVCLIVKDHLGAFMDESNGPARNQQLRLQCCVRWFDRNDGLGRIDQLTFANQERRNQAITRRSDHACSSRLILSERLRDLFGLSFEVTDFDGCVRWQLVELVSKRHQLLLNAVALLKKRLILALCGEERRLLLLNFNESDVAPAE